MTPEALESVFAQRFTDFEVVLVNDGSPDTEMLEHLIAPYQDRIVYLKQSNRGPAAARNTGIRAAKGKYIAFLDSDDRLTSSEFATDQSCSGLGHPSLAPSGETSGAAVGASDRPTRDHFRGANVGKLFVGITGSEGPIPHIKLDTG